MSSFLVMLAWGLAALFVFDRADVLAFISSAVRFLMDNKEAVLVTLAVVVALTVVGRAPQFRGR
jgi:hypothetical protein